jgi:hypothetical protein
MLLGLIAGFNPKALMMSNPQLANVLCTSPNHITKLLTELREFIRIEHPQSRYRKIYYSIQTDGVERNPVNPTGTQLNPAGGLLNPNRLHTQSVRIDKIKGTKESKETKERVDCLFEQFWANYPKKISKVFAHKAFSKLDPDDALFDTMLDALDQYRYSEQWSRNDGQFIPYPANWITNRRWEDQIEDYSTGCCMTREVTEEEAEEILRRV